MTKQHEQIRWDKKPDKCPKCGGEIGGLQYPWGNPNHYDGVSEWFCIRSADVDGRNCHYHVGRWTGKELKDGEWEPPYGITDPKEK
jgi:hypothetical protein